MSDADPATVAILEPAGAVSSRAAVQFEKDVLERLGKGSRAFVIDFAKVELFTSAGIRVLVMLRQRLRAIRGQLVLCAMSPHVRLVFDVAGLTTQFVIVDARDDAMGRAVVPAEVPAPDPDPEPEGVAPPSLAAAVREALTAAGVALPAARAAAGGPAKELASAVRAALDALPPVRR